MTRFGLIFFRKNEGEPHAFEPREATHRSFNQFDLPLATFFHALMRELFKTTVNEELRLMFDFANGQSPEVEQPRVLELQLLRQDDERFSMEGTEAASIRGNQRPSLELSKSDTVDDLYKKLTALVSELSITQVVFCLSPDELIELGNSSLFLQ